jgi:NAD(P)-dependent dehydrogenase (short-subunit alcohol dehydrogenase family)
MCRMSRTAFITDLDTSLGVELARRYLDEGYRVFATVSQTVEDEGAAYSPLEKAAGENLTVQLWKRFSPFSAKSMILQAIAKYDNVDETLILGNPSLEAPDFHETDMALIDKTVDSWIKGSLFLLKEILSLYSTRGGGIIALISQKQAASNSPLEGAIRYGFSGICQALLKSHGSDNIAVNGFESSAELTEEFAEFIFRNLSERGRRVSGKWFRFHAGILSSLKAGRGKPAQ